MTRTYQYPLTPNRHQAATLTAWLGACCDVYNAALQQRREAYRCAGKTLTRYDQQVQLTELRAADPTFAAVPTVPLRSPLARLDHAFRAFFRRCKSGEKPGYPRFRSRLRYDTIGLGRAKVVGNHVHVPKLGPVKFHRYRPLAGVIRNVTISRSASRWWVSFACEVGETPSKQPVRSAVGIDLGLTSFATLSTGEAVENPRYFRHGAEQLAARQRRLSRYPRTHRSRTKDLTRRLVGKAHEHIRNQRQDHARKLAVTLFSRFDLVAHEALEIRRMVGGNLAKSIHDAGWGIFLRALYSKAESAGKWAVPVNPRGTSQRCSACGATVSKTLAERTHACACGLVLGRDHNAAINVLALGLSARENP